MKLLGRILLLLTSTFCFPQFSKTHYIPPLSNSDTQVPQNQYIYISCPSQTPVDFKIINLGGGTVNGTVTRDNPYSYLIGDGFDTQLMVSESDVATVKANKGFIVEASDLVYVTVRLTTTPENYQAGGIVSKGLAALGTDFRVGAFINKFAAGGITGNHYTFVSMLATENNTTIQFSDIKPGVTLINLNGGIATDVVLNRGESYVLAVKGPNIANADGMIGALVHSDKPIAVNCGSIAGTNGSTSNLDLGFDQIVSAERTGKEYIFIRGNGINVTERPLIVAHENGTDVFLGTDTTPIATLAAGEYLALSGSDYSADGNLYVHTSKNVFAYQGIGGSTDQANQNMSFVPPLSCQTPKIINNIPFINRIGNITDFVGTVTVVTEVGATLSFIIDGTTYTIADLPGIAINGPLPVEGNTGFVTYTFEGFQGNVSVFSTKQVYVNYFGSSGFATYGGFYSGFTFNPEIAFQKLDPSSSSCIPNTILSVNALSAFDQYQWFFNGNPIPGATGNTYTPAETPTGFGPGFYYVQASISGCISALPSDNIPVSSCAADTDNDAVPDNIDLDNDNDGILNCTESYGSQPVNMSTGGSGSISTPENTYPYTFSGSATGTFATTPFTGNADGSFTTEVPSGLANSYAETVSFSNPVNVALQYIQTATDISVLTNSDGNFVVRVPVDKTLTVLDPDGQLLIDTNYDGVFESGITAYSSFEIRFRLNSTTPLAAGSGTFGFYANDVNAITFLHKNLSDTDSNKASFRLSVTCLPKDSDHDGIADAVDRDSDNDGITDQWEAFGPGYTATAFADANQNGVDDANEGGLGSLDTDGDGIPDYLDRDSDNDGIFDLAEAGYAAADTNNDGKVDGAVGTNGLLDALESAADSNTLSANPIDSDADGIANYIEKDSDNDGCNDVTEAGFTDTDNDGFIGNTPLTVDASGVVTGQGGYSVPNNNYTIGAPISITAQPVDITACEDLNAQFTVASNGDTFRWQVSTDGVTFNDITDGTQYSGTATATLTVANILPSLDGYDYRVRIDRTGNSCGLISAPANLHVLAKPVVPAIASLVQCDDDTDGLSDFNLRQKEPLLSTNAANEVFTYFTSQIAAENADDTQKINNPNVYNNVNGNTVFVRTQNANGCYSITRLNLTVTVTQIPPGTSWSFSACDDYIDAVNDDRDGISKFDFSSVTNNINALLSPASNYTVSYYKNEADALAETDANGISLAITNIANYRNAGYPGQQSIWVRVDNTSDNACFGLGPYITLKVEALPIANPVTVAAACDDDTTDTVVTHAFNTSNINTVLLNGQTNVSVTFTDQNGNALPSPLPNPFVTATQDVTARLTNNTGNDPNGPCFDETVISFRVESQPVANAFPVAPECDDNLDGLADFDTSAYEAAILNGQTGFIVTYTAENGNALPSPLPATFTTATQDVTVTVTNPLNPVCTASMTLSFVVNPSPKLMDPNNEIICSGIVNENVQLNAGLIGGNRNAYYYEWYHNDQLIPGATGYSLTVNLDGDYKTKVIDKITGCFAIRINTVVYSQAAKIDAIDIKDLEELGTVTVTASGSGDYQYSIDNPQGPFTANPVFENVTPGIHTVYVSDKLGCGVTKQEIAVVGAMQFFTPNGDGYNDYWKIRGVNASFHKNSSVMIFDRYGKLVHRIPVGTDLGWDGTLNGNPLPADDYWFVLYLDDGREARGHFALKR